MPFCTTYFGFHKMSCFEGAAWDLIGGWAAAPAALPLCALPGRHRRPKSETASRIKQMRGRLLRAAEPGPSPPWASHIHAGSDCVENICRA